MIYRWTSVRFFSSCCYSVSMKLPNAHQQSRVQACLHLCIFMFLWVCWCMFMCICATVYACKYICACVWGWWGELYVCEYCMHIKKRSSWDESGAAHVETLWAETVSMRSIMRQGWALMWLLSSPPIGSSLCVYVSVWVCVRASARGRSVCVCVGRGGWEGAAPSHPSFLFSLHPFKKYPKNH